MVWNFLTNAVKFTPPGGRVDLQLVVTDGEAQVIVSDTGEGIEPLYKDKSFADMNRNGVWDRRETPVEAWRRLGLLKQGEDLTREVYVACVKAAAACIRQK